MRTGTVRHQPVLAGAGMEHTSPGGVDEVALETPALVLAFFARDRTGDARDQSPFGCREIEVTGGAGDDHCAGSFDQTDKRFQFNWGAVQPIRVPHDYRVQHARAYVGAQCLVAFPLLSAEGADVVVFVDPDDVPATFDGLDMAVFELALHALSLADLIAGDPNIDPRTLS